MSNLLDDHQKFSSSFVMALKGSCLTSWARRQMARVLTSPDLLSVPVNLLRGCRIVQEKLVRIAELSIRHIGSSFFDL